MQLQVAIVYWGLTRSAKDIYKTHEEFIYKILKEANIMFDVYLHSWKTDNPLVWWHKQPMIDYNEYKVFQPCWVQYDSQDDFLSSLNFSEYFDATLFEMKGDHPNGEWYPQLIKNHLCALESMKRATAAVLASGIKYSHILYVRPDVRIESPFPVHLLSQVDDFTIVIPDYEHNEGYNDKFAIVTRNSCIKYTNRGDHIREFRKTHGRIVSEKYTKYCITREFSKILMTPFKFSLIRPPK